MKNLNVAVLFGGCSSEYEVSLQSAYAVITNMDREKYNPIMVGITRQGEWFHFTGDPAKIPADTWCTPEECLPATVRASRKKHELLVFPPSGIVKIKLDVAFPVLHGKNREDGTVQGMLELFNIPLAGCNTLASALCMDKDKAHKLAQMAGVAVPRALVFNKGTELTEIEKHAEELTFPLFVKPVKAGSSMGISQITTASQLKVAAQKAFEQDDQIIMEETIAGFEVGCAIMGNMQGELIIGEVDEIELSGGFFNFTEKYNLVTSSIHVPARITPQQAAATKETAKRIYRALGCSGFARVDMFLTPEGTIVFNEVNTIPGFTSHSRFPNMMKEIGMPLEKIITKAIELAVEK